MGCCSSKGAKALNPQRKNAIVEKIEMNEELWKTFGNKTEKTETNSEDKDTEMKEKETTETEFKVSKLTENGEFEGLEISGNKQTIQEVEKAMNKQIKVIETNVTKQTPEKSEKSANKQTPEKSEKSVNKQTPEKSEKSVNKQTPEKSEKSVNKQTPEKAKSEKSVNKQTTSERNETTATKQTPLECFQEQELSAERVKQALTRYFHTRDNAGAIYRDPVSREVLTCYPNLLIQPACRLDRLVCQTERVASADSATYVITRGISSDNTRRVLYVFHVFARSEEYWTAEGPAPPGEYLSAPYLTDGSRSGDPVECTYVRIDSQDLSGEKLRELFSLRGETDTGVFEWREEMAEQDFKVGKGGVIGERFWDFAALDGIAIVV